MKKKSVATEYLLLTNQWETTNPEIIASNTEKYLTDKYPDCKIRSALYGKLSEITRSSKHTVYAWFNQSRENVKIPLVKLCMIAEDLHVDVQEFLVVG